VPANETTSCRLAVQISELPVRIHSAPPTSRSIFRQSGESLKIGARAGFAEIARGEIYHNYRSVKQGLTEHAAMSAFCKNPSGELFNTYSCYARGLDTLNAATGST
jgi:hypothetical protein